LTVLRANWKKASAFGISSFKSRTRLRSNPCATPARANFTALSSKSPSAKASNRGVSRSFSEGTVAPEAIILSAGSTPSNRGSR